MWSFFRLPWRGNKVSSQKYSPYLRFYSKNQSQQGHVWCCPQRISSKVQIILWVIPINYSVIWEPTCIQYSLHNETVQFQTIVLGDFQARLGLWTPLQIYSVPINTSILNILNIKYTHQTDTREESEHTVWMPDDLLSNNCTVQIPDRHLYNQGLRGKSELATVTKETWVPFSCICINTVLVS